MAWEGCESAAWLGALHAERVRVLALAEPVVVGRLLGDVHRGGAALLERDAVVVRRHELRPAAAAELQPVAAAAGKAKGKGAKGKRRGRR